MECLDRYTQTDLDGIDSISRFNQTYQTTMIIFCMTFHLVVTSSKWNSLIGPAVSFLKKVDNSTSWTHTNLELFAL